MEKLISDKEREAVKKMKRAIGIANELYKTVTAGGSDYYGKGIAITTIATKLFDNLDIPTTGVKSE